MVESDFLKLHWDRIEGNRSKFDVENFGHIVKNGG